MRKTVSPTVNQKMQKRFKKRKIALRLGIIFFFPLMFENCNHFHVVFTVC